MQPKWGTMRLSKTVSRSFRVSLFSFAVIWVLAIPAGVKATDVRGRIDGKHSYSRSPFPVSKARVELWRLHQGKWRSVSLYVTGSDGMYYFSNIRPGLYKVVVNRGEAEEAERRLEVYDQRYQNIAPILLRH